MKLFLFPRNKIVFFSPRITTCSMKSAAGRHRRRFNPTAVTNSISELVLGPEAEWES